MPEIRELQQRRRRADGRPSTVDRWNESIAIPGPVRGLDSTTTTTTTNAAVQTAKQKPSTPTAGTDPSSTSTSTSTSSDGEILLNGHDDIRTSPTRPTLDDLRSAAPTAHAVLSAARTATASALDFALRHPNLARRYALPFALSVFSRPLVAVLPLGPLGPIVGFVAVAGGRFRLRRALVGGGYAVLHAVGMAGVKGQALSLLGLVGLEATGSKRLRDTLVTALMESHIGLRTQIIGLAIAAISTSTGAFASLGSLLGARAMALLFRELRSFATFHGLKWAATNLQTLWRAFCASGAVVRSSFLSYVLQQPRDDGGASQGRASNDARRLRWARSTLEQIATRIRRFPVEAVAPELAAVLKAWDAEQASGATSGEVLDEWVEIDAEDESSIWGDVHREEREDGAAETRSVAVAVAASAPASASVHPSSVEDSSHRHSRAENAEFLVQVARETIVKSGMSERDTTDRLAKMGFGARQPWSMEVEEVEEVDSDVGEYDDGIEVVDLSHA